MWHTEIPPMPFLLESLVAFSAGFTLSSACLVLLTMSTPFKARWAHQYEPAQIIATLTAGALLALAFASTFMLIIIAIITAILCLLLRKLLPNFSAAGICYTVQAPLIIICGICWYISWVSDLGLNGWYFALFVIVPVLNFAEMLLDYILCMGSYSLLIRKTWLQPALPLVSLNTVSLNMPFVSVHVPCHAEPPQLVISTLEALAKLKYENYEVMVCDNNTHDARLWQPVKAHCHQLNQQAGKERFRFFHVENLAGAKAGALNYCLDRLNPVAELIAVVDADYIANPDFLRDLIPQFDDPQMDFVQTSHDYYDGETGPFHRLCYWEYLLGTKFSMAGLNELSAAFTIGTMCILRRKAVEEAGRWAEWCLTEDSEIAVRLRARGGKGRYFRATYGRGTMPDTFTDWKRQRFRWTAGPVQQLLRHWRLFLPRWMGGSTALSGWSKVFESVRSIQMLASIIMLIGLLVTSVSLLLVSGLAAPDASASIPGLGYIIILSLSVSWLILTGTGYWLAGCRSLRLIFAAMGAGAALIYTRMLATSIALMNIPLAWKRTPKFSSRYGRLQALEGALPEMVMALLLLLLLVLLIVTVDDENWIILLITGAGLLRFTLCFLAAPAMALMALKRKKT